MRDTPGHSQMRASTCEWEWMEESQHMFWQQKRQQAQPQALPRKGRRERALANSGDTCGSRGSCRACFVSSWFQGAGWWLDGMHFDAWFTGRGKSSRPVCAAFLSLIFCLTPCQDVGSAATARGHSSGPPWEGGGGKKKKKETDAQVSRPSQWEPLRSPANAVFLHYELNMDLGPPRRTPMVKYSTMHYDLEYLWNCLWVRSQDPEI